MRNPVMASMSLQLSEEVLNAAYVGSGQAEKTLGAGQPVYALTPTDGPPLQWRFRSWPNASPGVGRNNGMWFGWNAGLHAQDGSFVPGDAAMFMGFETSWYDSSDGTQGPEWYVEYGSPDGTTVGVADLRPFYARVLNGLDNSTPKSVITHTDIGAGPDGQFTVWGGVITNPLFYVTHSVSHFTNQLAVDSGVMSVQSTSGGASSIVDGKTGTYAEQQFRFGGVQAYGWQATSLAQMYLKDRDSTPIFVFNYGASNDARLADLRCVLRLSNSQVTTATAGAAAALPATPQGYFQIQDASGTLRKVPYYV